MTDWFALAADICRPDAVPERRMTPKQRFLAYIDEHGITVSHERLRAYHHHLHVYAPSTFRFSGAVVDNLSLWDSDQAAPDWAECLADLQDAMPLEPDPDYEP